MTFCFALGVNLQITPINHVQFTPYASHLISLTLIKVIIIIIIRLLNNRQNAVAQTEMRREEITYKS